MARGVIVSPAHYWIHRQWSTEIDTRHIDRTWTRLAAWAGADVYWRDFGRPPARGWSGGSLAPCGVGQGALRVSRHRRGSLARLRKNLQSQADREEDGSREKDKRSGERNRRRRAPVGARDTFARRVSLSGADAARVAGVAARVLLESDLLAETAVLARAGARFSVARESGRLAVAPL